MTDPVYEFHADYYAIVHPDGTREVVAVSPHAQNVRLPQTLEV